GGADAQRGQGRRVRRPPRRLDGVHQGRLAVGAVRAHDRDDPQRAGSADAAGLTARTREPASRSHIPVLGLVAGSSSRRPPTTQLHPRRTPLPTKKRPRSLAPRFLLFPPYAEEIL